MTPERWTRLKSLFEQAVEMQEPDRALFLAAISENNPAIGGELNKLLQHHNSETNDLDKPLLSRGRLLEYFDAGLRAFQSGDTVGERFLIQRFLGEGGMGEVYVARDLELAEIVAVKTLRPAISSDTRMVESFKQEVQLARRVTHPNVCRVFDIFWHHANTHTPIAVLTMEYLDGKTLHSHIHDHGSFKLETAWPIARQIVEGLSAAHSAGIVHGDFKSSNVMLITQNEQFRAVVTDFGLAHEQRASLEKRSAAVGSCPGTPAYMAPEQLHGAPLTPAADIYALGIVLFEMIAGRRPFEGNATTSLTQRFEIGPCSSARHLPSLGRRWNHIVFHCLDPDPSKRPTSSEVLALFTAKAPVRWGRNFLLGLAAAVLLITLMLGFKPHVPRPEARSAVDSGRVAIENQSKEGFAKAIDEYQRAIALDPRWAEPYAELAYAYAAGSNFRYIDGTTARRQAHEAALKAISLDSKLAKAYGALGWTQSLDFDAWPDAEDSFRKALELGSDDGQIRYWFGVHLRKKGRFTEAEEQDNRALSLLHKHDPSVWSELAFLYWTSNQVTKFHNHMAEQLKAYPNFELTRYLYARLLKIEQKFDQAENELSFAEKLGMNPVTVMAERASLEVHRGNPLRAREYVRSLEKVSLEQEVDGLLIAGVYAALHDDNAAFETLEKSYDRRDNTLLSLATTPVLQQLRADPRFKSLLRRLHFTDQIMQQMEFNSSSVKGDLRHPIRTGTS